MKTIPETCTGPFLAKKNCLEYYPGDEIPPCPKCFFHDEEAREKDEKTDLVDRPAKYNHIGGYT